jgi:hypothetical protein
MTGEKERKVDERKRRGRSEPHFILGWGREKAYLYYNVLWLRPFVFLENNENEDRLVKISGLNIRVTPL